ncbi:hypothetical protein ACHAPI_010010 [Fusarium lateritium]
MSVPELTDPRRSGLCSKRIGLNYPLTIPYDPESAQIVNITAWPAIRSREAGLAVGWPERPWRSSCQASNALKNMGPLGVWASRNHRYLSLEDSDVIQSREARAENSTNVSTNDWPVSNVS